jgi:ferrous iron transport protein B
MSKSVEKDRNLITVGLIGNPNTGKTSLLNCLAGTDLHVGNWPGKTVEKKEGIVAFRDIQIKIVDLPGLYSIAPYSEEEKIARDFLAKQNADVIVQIIDVNALKRNLLMTLELLSLKKNIILAFNFNKEARSRGIKIDIDKIKNKLKVPIVEIEANTGENKEKLLEEIIKVAKNPPKIPAYIKKLMKNKIEVDHGKSIKFLSKNIDPYYSAKKGSRISEKIDSIILNKYTALPILFVVVLLMFFVTFNLSSPLVDFLSNFFNNLCELFGSLDFPDSLKSLIARGIIGGIGSVLAFTPLIFVLFVIIAILEDSGYLPRTVVLIDRLFQKFGISGRTFIPMILGFGCNVPAIMATRTIKSRKEKLIAIFINPFMSCSARLPVYVLFTKIFFPQTALITIMILYLFGVVTAFAASLILGKILDEPNETALILELPPYRVPSLGTVLKQAWYGTGQFIKKAGSIIFATVLIIWFLASFPLGVEYGSAESLLGRIGKLIAPIFKPLGFGKWEFAVALIFGFVAKEVIIGTLGTLYGEGKEGLATILPYQISPLAALSFLFFVLLYTPCMATISVIKKETNSWRFTIFQIIASNIIAWLVALVIYNIGIVLG